MKALSLKTDFPFRPPYEISDVHFDSEGLVVTIESATDSVKVITTFSEVAGFRLLDEGDLLEFWPTCAASNGWIFQILEGGWFEQESQRDGFLKKDVNSINEFFMASQNGCVSVLAWEIPMMQFAG